jgi:hypothetical protein
MYSNFWGAEDGRYMLKHGACLVEIGEIIYFITSITFLDIIHRLVFI